MQYVFVIRYGGTDARQCDVSGVFTTEEEAGQHWEFVTRDLGDEKPYYMERWPLGQPLYPGRDYSWPTG